LRNREREWQYLTIPLKKAHREALICEIQIDNSASWHENHIKSIQTCYGKTALNHPIMIDYARLLPGNDLLPFLNATLDATARFLRLDGKFIDSRDVKLARLEDPEISKAEARILEICQGLGASTYVNLPGGTHLYRKSVFERFNIELEFLPPLQGTNYLSILDLCLGESLTEV
jgi:hypothetical protein